MRNALLMSLLTAALAGAAFERAAAQSQPAPAPRPTQQPAAQQPAKPAPPTTTAPKPAPPAPAGQTTTPAPRRPAAAAPAGGARGGMAITVTDAGGGTIGGVKVTSDGPTPRNGETNASGQLNFPGLLGGTYRLRFDGDAVVSFEREVTVRPGQVLAVDVMLNAAKKVPPPPAPTPV